MKTSIYQSLSFVLLFGLATLNLQADPVQDLKQSLSSGDPSVRADAMQHFVNSEGTVNGSATMKPAIPILVKALEDSDVEVRRSAALGLLGIAALTSRVINPPMPNGPDLTADPINQGALLKAISDSDDEVRLTAMKAYSATYKLTPDVEDKIIAEFHSPDSVANDPSEMIECLILSRTPSVKAKNFLSNLLDDPKFSVHVAERMGADKCPLSSDALGKLAVKLGEDKDPVHRAAFARAIGAYGKQAQQYMPQLQAALANEKDEVTKQNLKATIAKTQ
jgi:hypothetical protein